MVLGVLERRWRVGFSLVCFFGFRGRVVRVFTEVADFNFIVGID